MFALTQTVYIENGEYNLGESRIIDYKGEEIASIKIGEEIVDATLDIDLMYDVREKSPTVQDIRDNYEVCVL